MVQLLEELGVERIYLPDTLGILSPEDVTRYIGLMTATWPDLQLRVSRPQRLRARDRQRPGGGARGSDRGAHQRERHGGAHGQHAPPRGRRRHSPTTPLCAPRVVETKLTALSRMVETFTGKDVATNTPIVGRDVYTHTGGIHADGDVKGNLYGSTLAPARFGERRRYALGKLAGKASLGPQPEATRDRSRSRGSQARTAAHQGPRRQEEQRQHRGPAVHHRRRAEEPRRATRAGRVVPRDGGHRRSTHRGADVAGGSDAALGRTRRATAATTPS